MKIVFDDPETIYALATVADFFSYHGLDYASMDMQQLLHYASSHKHFSSGPPYTLVLFTKSMRQLIDACFVIEKTHLLQESLLVAPGPNGLPDLSIIQHFMPPQAPDSWTYLPRNLSPSQYLNPIKAMRQLVRYASKEAWHTIMDQLLECALSKSSIHDNQPPLHILKLRRILLQCLEAAHLVFIRYTYPQPVAEEV
jgi:hypothetical protein